MTWGRLFITCLLCLCSLWCTLQGFTQPLLTVPYSLEDGLVQSQVTEIFQDSKGYMWFGTLGGLSRFDGQHFTNFTMEDGLASTRIFGLAEDHQGRLWIGTPKGIHVYDGATFTHLTTNDGLLNDEVYELLGLASGDIWIASRTGLTFYDGESFSHITEIDGLISPFILSLATDASGRLWAGTAGGVCVLQDPKPTCYSEDNGLPASTVGALLVDERDRVWAGTPKGIGLLLPGKDNNRFITLDYLPENLTSSILEDRTGAIWISNRKGVYRVDESMQITDRWDNGRWVGADLYQDQEGTVWAGTYGRGVIQFRPTAFTNQAQNLNLPEDVYLSVYEDPDSVLWVGTRYKGLYRIDNDEIEHFAPEAYPFLDHIRNITQGPDGVLWLAIADGVARYDASGFTHLPSNPGFNTLYTSTVYPDSNGVTWAGNLSGLYKIHNDSVSAIPLPISNGGRTIHTIEKQDQRMWVGAEEGLMYLQDDSLHHAPLLQGIPILSIAPNPSGQLWLGTMGNGVYLYDPASETLADSIHVEDGLNSGGVYFVQLDQYNHLWVGTNKGINKIYLNSVAEDNGRHIKVFAQKDGVVGVETNKNAVTIDHRGQLWFGTLKALMKYNAVDEPINTYLPPVYLTGVQLFLDPLPSDRPSHESSTFTHEENHLTFHFQGLSYIAPDHVYYQYRLQGFDKDWSPLTQNRFATYSNLAPGTYTFEVRARNSDGFWSKKPASFGFLITPPYWQTNWFRGIVAMGVLLFLAGIVQLRTSSIRKRSKQLELMVTERTSELKTTHQSLLEAREDALQAARTRSAFLSTMTHELRTPMNGILGMAQLLSFTELDEEQVDYSATILESSTVLLDLIENLLTFADLSAGKRVMQEETFNLNELIDTATASIESRIQGKNLETRYYISPSLPTEIKADREHIRQVLKHLLSNAVKFTTSGLVYLDVEPASPTKDDARPTLLVSVHDTGIGIAPERLERIFKSFTQLDMTATRSFDGTGIGLTLARQLAELMGGHLYAESKPGVGSSFYLSIPADLPNILPDPSTEGPAEKRVFIVISSEREKRRIALICRSLGMKPELVAPSALLGEIQDVDLVLTETRLENEHINWLADDDAPDALQEGHTLGMVVDPEVDGPALEEQLRSLLEEGSAA